MEHDEIEEGRRWLLQAKKDLDDARYNLEGERYHYLLVGDGAVRKMQKSKSNAIYYRRRLTLITPIFKYLKDYI